VGNVVKVVVVGVCPHARRDKRVIEGRQEGRVFKLTNAVVDVDNVGVVARAQEAVELVDGPDGEWQHDGEREKDGLTERNKAHDKRREDRPDAVKLVDEAQRTKAAECTESTGKTYGTDKKLAPYTFIF